MTNPQNPQPLSTPSPLADTEQEKELYSVYEDYAKTLRTWLVAYGVGFPAVVLSRKELFDSLKNSPHFKVTVLLFLSGTLTLIVLAFLNKWAAWIRFSTTARDGKEKGWIHKFADWYSDQFYIDVSFEILALVSFFVATYTAFQALAQ